MSARNDARTRSNNNLQTAYASAVYYQRLASHESCHWRCQKKSRVGNILRFSPPAERVGPRASTFISVSAIKRGLRLYGRGRGGIDSARRYGVSSNLKRPELES